MLKVKEYLMDSKVGLFPILINLTMDQRVKALSKIITELGWILLSSSSMLWEEERVSLILQLRLQKLVIFREDL